MTLLFIYFGAALSISFLCSLLEAVLLSVTPAYVSVLAATGSHLGARLAQVKNNLHRSLASILTLNTIGNCVGAALVGAQALKVAEAYDAKHESNFLSSNAVAIASGAMTMLILVCSEIIPKTLGALHWKRLTTFAAFAIPGLIFITYPFVVLLDAISRVFSRKGLQGTVTRAEILATAELGQVQGTLMERESRIIKNLFLLGSLLVRDIMTPRSVMLAFPADQTVAELVDSGRVLTFSRLPIYEENLDQITGFATRYKIMRAYATGSRDRTLREISTRIDCVPEAMTVASLLETLIHSRHHMVLVVDEYGGTAGIVTLEDTVETLLGVEIVDESDSVEDMRKLARELGEKRRIAHAALYADSPDEEEAD